MHRIDEYIFERYMPVPVLFSFVERRIVFRKLFQLLKSMWSQHLPILNLYLVERRISHVHRVCRTHTRPASDGKEMVAFGVQSRRSERLHQPVGT